MVRVNAVIFSAMLREIARAGARRRSLKLHVGLLNGVSKLRVGRALGINHGASGVARRLVHGSIVDESLGVCGGGVLSSDLHAIVHPHADARGRRARVDADSHAEDFVH